MQNAKRKMALILITAFCASATCGFANENDLILDENVNSSNIENVFDFTNTNFDELENSIEMNTAVEPTIIPTTEPSMIPTATTIPTTITEPTEEPTGNPTEIPTQNSKTAEITKPPFQDMIDNDTLTKYNDEITTFTLSTVVDSGKCGDNLTWTLYNTGELVISGTGAMTNYLTKTINSDIVTTAPWRTYYKTELKKLTIQEGVTSIGNCAFAGCSGFTSALNLPKSLTSIGNETFFDCSGFTGNLTIPKNVTYIGVEAFNECSGFNGKLILPEGITTIEDSAFYKCSNLTGDLIIPNSITTLNGHTFYGCSGFNGKLKMPSHITQIGDFEFTECSNLHGDVKIPEGVTSIGLWAFQGCSNINRIFIPNSIETIEDEVFFECENISSAYIAKTTDSIDLWQISLNADNIYWLYDESSTGKCGDNLTWTLYDNGELIITGIGDMYDYTAESVPWKNYKNNITALVLDEGITSITDNAFSGCSGFTGSLTIPDTVTSIGSFAFCDCSGITGSLILPDGITSIGSNAFDGCSGFTGSLTIPNTVTLIGDCAFANCSNFTESLTIPDGVTSIGSAAFENCSSLTGTLIIPDSVTSIQSDAFGYCINITDMYLNREENSISTGSFPNKVHWAYDLSTCIATLDQDAFIYTGKEIKPNMTLVSANGNTLYADEDYVFTYSNNINAGKSALISISAPTDGISYNTNSTYFTINPKSCEDLIIEPIPDKIFSGVAHTPDVIIKNMS